MDKFGDMFFESHDQLIVLWVDLPKAKTQAYVVNCACNYFRNNPT